MHRKNNTERPNYLILQKCEWNRLKKQSNPPENPSNDQSEYVKKLIEKSNAWTKTWPDSERGCIAIYEKERQKRHEANLAAVKLSADKRKNKTRKLNEQAIKEAKEKIFQQTCYGQKLVCALRESKTLEERDVQVQLLKQIRNQGDFETNQLEPSCSFGLDKHATDEEQVRKCKAVQTAQQNKEMYEKQKAEMAMAKEAQIHEDLENTLLTQRMLDLEAEAEEKVRLLEQEALEQYLADRKKSKEDHAKSEAEYYAKIEMCQKEKEELNCKIKKVLQDVHKGADNLPWAKKNYEAFKQRQEEEMKRIKALEEKYNETKNQEQESKEKEKQALAKRLSIAETNKAMAEYEKQLRCPHLNKCYCDRQSLFVQSQNDCMKKNEIVTPQVKPAPCFGSRNKLMSELKKRMQEPPPWTGVKAMNEEFARHADNTLKECKYKNPVRKVVDEYVKYSRPDTLDVPNYY